MAYTSSTIVAAHLGLSSTDDDAILTTLAAEAKDTIDRLTGRTFEAAGDTTRYLDANYAAFDRTLYLDSDLAQITAIVNGDTIVLDQLDYTTSPLNNGRYYAITLTPESGKRWTGVIEIVGMWAYSITPPAIIQQAARDMVSIAYRQRENLTDTTRPILTGDGVIIMPDDYPKSLRTVLATLKRLV